MDFVKAATVQDAVEQLRKAGANGLLLAGGTDVMVAGNRKPFPEETVIIDLGGLKELRQIWETPDALHIGALVTDTELLASEPVRTFAPALAQAAAASAGPQVRNRATIGGNIGTASPSGDLVTALWALDATVTVAGADGTRQKRLDEIVVGVKRTTLEGEVITEITVPKPGIRTSSAFEKMGKRKAMTISLASTACAVTLNPALDAIESVKIAIGASAPTVVRATAAEQAMVGLPLDLEALKQQARLTQESISPITDTRATSWYRREIVPVLVAGTVWKAAQQLKSEEAGK